jgi:RNA polymerase sigma-70 factor, ECF subfamily
MMWHDRAGDERARRFRDAALPYLNDVYRLAYFLLRNQADAEDAAQECYLRALRHFDRWRGSGMKPWLLAILRNVCYSELGRRRRQESPTDPGDWEQTAEKPLWQEPQALDVEVLSRHDGRAMRQLVAALPTQYREVIVLREFSEMSYREIAEVTGIPIGTVMSRLARARAILLARWTDRDAAVQRSSRAASADASTAGRGAVVCG